MTVKYSRAFLNEVTGGRSVREAYEDCVLDVYEGTVPTNPEDARTGTKLARYTLSGGAVAVTDRSEPRSYKITVPNATLANTCKVNVTVDGVGPTTYTFTITAAENTDIKVARKIAQMLNDIPQIRAIADNTITAPAALYAECRIAGLALTLADGAGTTTLTVTAQYAAVRKNTLQFSAPTAGVISKPTGDTWQCSSNLATGVAGYFTLCTPDDTGALDSTYTKKRVQGTLATVGGDAIIDPATITAAAVSTVTSFSLTLPTSKT
jgi:hypothetical protein